MKSFYLENRYGSGHGPNHDHEYDYLLFRQDWGGQESVLFNKNELDEVFDLINSGDIPIHHNYSILYCRTQELLDVVKDSFECYATLIPQKS